MSQFQRILLGHLASFGDCLYATTVARQIKKDYPGCHLTWAIGSMFRTAIQGNPDVDEVWEYSLTNRSQIVVSWKPFLAEARRRIRRGDFSKAFFTQVAPGNYQNFDGTVRSSIFRGYPRPITVPINPVVRLQPAEIDRAHTFAEEASLPVRNHVILFECAATSGQSFVTPAFALEVARLLVAQENDCTVVLSSNVRIATGHDRILDGSSLTIRENAELSKYCTLLVGCSSGISWLCTSDWAKPLPTIQLLRGATSIYASMARDAEYFGLPTAHIIEMTECTPVHCAACISAAISGPFSAARKTFHQQIPVNLDFYFGTFVMAMLKQGEFVKALSSIRHVWKRFGRRPFKEYFSSIFQDL